MKNITVVHILLLTSMIISIMSCSNNNQNTSQNEITEENINIPSFTISVKPISTDNKFPLLQSFAWARYKNKLLLIGGRTEGFHGQSELDTVFSVHKANSSIWVIDLNTFSSSELPLDLNDPNWLQFTSSNMEFCQQGDNLFLVGGYGREKVTDYQSNYTFDQITRVNIPEMIAEVEKGSSGNPGIAVTGIANDPLLQVAGGELKIQNDIFYLMFGQNYKGAYEMGLTGDYTDEVRLFKFDGNSISDTHTFQDSILHRRDLNVETVQQSEGPFYVAYGGVFTADNNGFENPIRIYPNNGNPIINLDDSISQKTSQYNCAIASIYDPNSNSNIHVLFGGIGRYQYDETTGTWEDGDDGAKLPFVKTITQMIWNKGLLQQRIQLPPGEPALPALLGANAIFISNPEFEYADNVIDYSKITKKGQSIGILYGGIKSSRPTSSSIYPTSVNPEIYEVIVN